MNTKLSDLGLPLRLMRMLENGVGTTESSERGREAKGTFSSALSTYRDVFWAAEMTTEEREFIRDTYVMWLLAHVSRARARVNRNTARRRNAGT